MKSSDYIDMLKKQEGINDSKAAEILGLTRQAISGYRNSNNEMDDTVAIRIADLLSLNQLEVVASVRAARSKDDEAKSFWLKVASTAAVITYFTGGSLLTMQASDIPAFSVIRSTVDSILC